MDFVDSRGLFSCRIPADFLRAERAKDKKGTVFVSGNYNKAEVLSVQSLTAYDLLRDAGEEQCHQDVRFTDVFQLSLHPHKLLGVSLWLFLQCARSEGCLA